ncbi:MAG: hypothetical protein ACREU7_00285 [Burkholderiales bacterium]
MEAVTQRRPVASAEVLATPHGSAIAGWEQLTIELSAGPAGLRHVMVVLDGSGRPISACDTVLYCRPLQSPAAAVEGGDEIVFYQESIGGRIEADGSFRGTRWQTEGVERAEVGESKLESSPSQPSESEIAGIKALVAEVMRR